MTNQTTQLMKKEDKVDSEKKGKTREVWQAESSRQGASKGTYNMEKNV